MNYNYYIIKSELNQNSIILVCNQTNKAALIDPSNEKEIINKINQTNSTPEKILLTHGHYDHIQAVNSLKNKYKIPVICHKQELEYLQNPEKNKSNNISITPNKLISGNDQIKIGNLKVKAIHTPGHTKGSVSYYLPNLLISGDTLFKKHIGRTDLYGGNLQKLKISINKLLKLPGKTTVIPGHGNPTTIKYEKENNPFI